MNDKSKPEPGSEEHLEEVRKYLKQSTKGLFDPNNMPDFEESGPLAGSEALLEKTDAELFPDELEEYTPEERRPRVVVDNEVKKES